MALETSPFCPLIRGVVVVHVAQKETRRRLVNNQANVTAHAGGPEALVLRPLDLMELEPGMRRVHLQIEGRHLDRLLFVGGQLREAAGEGVGDAELHQVSISIGTPIWLATSVRRSTSTSGALTLTTSA